MNITNLIDTPRICTALAEWAACVTYIMILRRKWSGWKLYGVLGGMLAWFLLYQHLAGMAPLFLWIPGMLGAIFCMYLFIYFTCDVSRQDAGFCCVRAFVLAELAASLQWQLNVWMVIHFQLQSLILAAVIMLSVYLLLFAGYWFLEREHIPKDENLNITNKELSGAIIIALTAFIISNLSFVMPDTPFSSATSSILYVRTLVDFGGLVMLVTQLEKREELRMRGENQLMNVMLQRQYDQYRMSIDNIELLRREFHDLKHYMIAIRAEEDPKKRDQYLEEMEQAITAQEALTNTGNRVLDVVLTTKSTYCSQKQITFTCMADGSLISFMHVKDICSIFGNALDNAIECVSQFDDPEKRLVTMSMFRKNQFLMIQFENYTDTTLKLGSNHLPRTTKDNTQYHGYGLKSIQAAAQKYGGSMTLQSKDNWFTLSVLIPVE
ncbi:MAG: sensor histidine kinase [Hungatella hathewayi]|nr:sensor histidine kinase [Hungatella hathewayi]